MNKLEQIPVYHEELKELKKGMAAGLPPEISGVFNSDADQLARDYQHPLKLSVGDTAPLFELPNATGKKVSLKEILGNGPVVLVLYRGTWCPYCNLSLNAYQRILAHIKLLGANLIAVSPQTPDSSLSIVEKNALAFEVLSDEGNKVARQYTTVFKNGDKPVGAMSQLGVDFNSFYYDKSAEIPVPAVFIIGKNGKVAFAKTEGGDYRLRVEPREILDALKDIDT
jgi:peroxiredoxin